MGEVALQFESIFKKRLSDDGTEKFLEKIVEKYPYFTAAQFYLLKLTPDHSEKYNQLVSKTSLLFDNPHWLNYQLLEKAIAENIILEEDKKNLPNEKITTDSELDSGEDDLVLANESETMNIHLPDLSAPVHEDTLAFEPLHTTDYFASQGIKLSEEMRSDDKLGKNLKSFTEWLKTMKKIKAAELNKLADHSDADIQNLAEKSNTEGAVVTEAMADVLIKQGKTKKAIDVYKKLSLQNPLKSTYFAAKIENLKAT